VFSVVLFTLLFLALPSAKADSFSWSWSLSANGFSGSGMLTSDVAPKYYIFGYGYLVNSMSGQMNGVGLSLNTTTNSLLPIITGDTRAGLRFITSDGVAWTLLFNEWRSNPLPFNVFTDQPGRGTAVDLNVVATPEPSALALFGLGLISLLGLAAVKKYLPHRVRPVRRKQFQFQS
jgi:hypothetical protein